MMPYRAERVALIVEAYKHLFGSEDGRRQILAHLCFELNKTDGGQWGLLEKPGPRIPADILVWKQNLEHVDVLTDSGPMWKEHGRIQPDWKWIAAPPVIVSGPTFPATQPTPDPPDTTQTDRILAAVVAQVGELAGMRVELARLRDAIHAIPSPPPAVYVAPPDYALPGFEGRIFGVSVTINPRGKATPSYD